MLKKLFSFFSPNEWIVLSLFFFAFISVFAMVGVLILVPAFIFVSGQGKKCLPASWGEGLLFVFVGIAVVSTFLFSKDATVNSFQLKAWHLKALSILIVVLAFDVTFLLHTLTNRALIYGLKLSVFMSYFCFIISLVQKAMKWYANPDRPGRVASTFLNENYYGVMIECVVMISLYFFLQETNKIKRLFYFFAIPENLIGLWLCQCRTAFLVTGVAAFVFLILYNKKAILIAMALVFSGALIIWLFPTVLPRLSSLSDNTSFRIGIWRAAIRCFLDNPVIGRGYFAYSGIWVEYSNTTFFALHAHNLYIEMLLNFGITGFLSLFVYAGIQVKKSLSSCKGERRLLERALILSILTAFLLHGAFDTTAFWPQTGIFAAMILAGSNAYRNGNEEENQ